MNAKWLVNVTVALLLQGPGAVVSADQQHAVNNSPGLVNDVRRGTSSFQDIDAARDAGYALATGCVSGPQEGAMGVHYANGALIGDGLLNPERPELLMYEIRNGRATLVGVEFVVIADAWHATNAAPPVLKGQHFHYVGSPNRYGLPPFYELHVWAWRHNLNGAFADWNPQVSCDEYAPGVGRR
jgi:hypothetical protein